MTLDELVDVYFAAGGTGDGSTRAGIRAVVEALRDEMASGTAWHAINDILGGAGDQEPKP